MKKISKKLFSFILVLAMCISCIDASAITAFGQTNAAVTKIETFNFDFASDDEVWEHFGDLYASDPKSYYEELKNLTLSQYERFSEIYLSNKDDGTCGELTAYKVEDENIIKTEASDINMLAKNSETAPKYIYYNLNSKYISRKGVNLADVKDVAVLHVKNTYVEKSVVEECDNSLSKYLEKYANGDENEAYKGFLMSTQTDIPLYNISDNSEYVVGIIDTDEQSEIAEIKFAEYNDNGVVLDGEIFDANKSLVYIKKADLIKEVDGNQNINYVQAQILRAYLTTNTTINVEVANNNEESFVTSYEENITAPLVYIPLYEDPAKAQTSEITKDNVNIKVNGSEGLLNEDCYDVKSGTAIIDTTAANLSNVEIEIKEDTALDKLASNFGVNQIYAYQTNITPEEIMPKITESVNIGDFYKFDAYASQPGQDSSLGFGYVQRLCSVGGEQDFYNSLWGLDSNYSSYGWVIEDSMYTQKLWDSYAVNMNTQVYNEWGYQGEHLRNYVNNKLDGNGRIQLSCIDVSSANIGIENYHHFVIKVTDV